MLQILRDANALQGSLKYNYDAVDAGIREQVIEAALDIRQRINRAQGDLIATGQKLIETKAVLPHGQFQDWVETEFGFSQRTAQNFMNVAERFASKSETVSLFSDSALYLLAAPSTPAAAIDAAATEAAATGASPTKERVREIIAEHKPARVLAANETEVVIWRGIQNSGHAEPAAQLAWLDRSHISDFTALLNAGVTLDLQTFTDAVGKVRGVLQQQSRGADAALDREISRLHDFLVVKRGWGIVYAPMPKPCYVRKGNAEFTFANRDDKAGELAAMRQAKAYEEGQAAPPLAAAPADPLANDERIQSMGKLANDIRAHASHVSQPPVDIPPTHKALLNGTPDERVFLAKLVFRSIGALLDNMPTYGELTGKFLDIPPAERALRKMSDELRNLISTLES